MEAGLEFPPSKVKVIISLKVNAEGGGEGREVIRPHIFLNKILPIISQLEKEPSGLSRRIHHLLFLAQNLSWQNGNTFYNFLEAVMKFMMLRVSGTRLLCTDFLR